LAGAPRDRLGLYRRDPDALPIGVTSTSEATYCPNRRNNPEKETPLQVLVRENNVDQALRVLKKKLQREGLFREMKRRRSFEKPSERRVREKDEAIRRAKKAARKQAQREGLIATPKKRAPPGAGTQRG
jgi:small subunit ribosomal protein S21